MLPADEYYSGLPKRRAGSGALITNPAGQVLVVEPAYKPTWEIPGGVVEAGETPRHACARESREELGSDRGIGRLLVIEHKTQGTPQGDSLMFVYDGGVIDDPSAIHLHPEELRQFRFVDADELPGLMSAGLANRVRQAMIARRDGTFVEIENGEVLVIGG